jgi:hypothetical protein
VFVDLWRALSQINILFTSSIQLSKLAPKI